MLESTYVECALWSRPWRPKYWTSSSAMWQVDPRQSVVVFHVQGFPLSKGRLLSGSIFCHSGRTSGENRVLHNGDKKSEVEKLWRELFSDPTKWRDHRPGKANPRFPDFKHKKTQEGLWLNSKWIPAWVEDKLGEIPPGTLESSNFSTNQMLFRCVKAGLYEKTMELFEQMQRDGINSDRFTFVPVLNACAGLGILEDGRRIHRQIIQNGFEMDVHVGTSLMDMYAKCGSMEDARKLFNRMPTRDVVAWNAMLAGYVKCGQGQQALELFGQMEREGVYPDRTTFVGVLKACASVAALEEGRRAHKRIVERGYESSVFVASSLVDMYAKCGSIEDARRVFDHMSTRDLVVWSALLAGYVKCGEGQQALELFVGMQQEGLDPDPATFVVVLKACASIAQLEEGRRTHEQIIRRGYESNVRVGSSLVDMYAKCGSLEDARRVFNQIPTRDVVAWNAMLGGYVKCGKGKQALELFGQMQWEGIDPNPITFVGVLKACASIAGLEEGRCAHGQIIQRGYESHLLVGSSLIDMYAKCGSIVDALKVFNHLPTRDLVAWNAMLAGYVKSGEGKKALELFNQMQGEGVNPDLVTYLGVLNACAIVAELEEGRRAHEQIIQRGYACDVFLGSSLVDMYSKCGSMQDARRVFNQMPTRNVVAWSAILAGYVKCGEGQQALELFDQMQREGVDPNPVTFAVVLKACGSIAGLEEGRRAHELIIQRGYECDVFLGSSLVDMYSKCGSIEDAQRVFNQMSTRDVVAWNAMLAGYVKCGEGKQALELFNQMQGEGVYPNPGTFVVVLNACANTAGLREGRGTHEQIIRRGYESDVFVGSSLVDMYSKCGSIEDARRVFNQMPTRNVVAWNAMLGGYVKCGRGQQALELFSQMQQEGVDPDRVTFVGLLNACASMAALEEGRCAHEQIIERGYESGVFVGSSLVHMYAKCGSICDAREVFNQIPTRDVVTWNAMLGGYGKCGEGKLALELFGQMQGEGVDPDSVRFVGVLNACGSVAGLEEGKRAHEQIIQRGYEADVFVGSSLVDMYAKCGSINDARNVFDQLAARGVVAWNAMLAGYVRCGQGQQALELFGQMQQEGVDPDHVTFVVVLNACGSIAALEEGRRVHEQIICGGYESDVVMGSSLADMYAKCGSIEDAWTVFNQMPTRDVVAWNAMLAGYVKCGEGKQAIELFGEMQGEGIDPDRLTFVAVLNACASVAGLEEGMRVHEQIIQRGYESDVFVGSSLVDMYAKCGSIEDAQRVFNQMPTRDVVA